MNTATRIGFLTSEFLLTVLGVIVLAVLIITGDVDPDWGAPAIAAATLGYNVSRAVVKKATVDGANQINDYKSDLALLAATPAAPAGPQNVGTMVVNEAAAPPPIRIPEL